MPALGARAGAASGAGVLTGAYSMSLVTGATVATFTAIPFERRVRRVGAGAGDLGAAGAGRRRRLGAARGCAPTSPVAAPVGHAAVARADRAGRSRCFMGLQSMAFFSTITWLPEILDDDGISEGYAGSCRASRSSSRSRPRSRSRCSPRGAPTQTRPAGGDRRHRVRRPARRAAGCPDAALLWMVFLGIGQGGALGLGADPPGPARPRPGPGGGDDRDVDGRRLPDRRRPARRSWARSAISSGDWTWPVIVLLAMTAVQVPAAWRAVTIRHRFGTNRCCSVQAQQRQA